MLTIWFRLHGESSQEMRLEIAGVDYAQATWDKLKAAGFYMTSARP